MKYNINKIAVIGSGIMGSRIACLFASIQKEVLLFDMVSPNDLSKTDKKSRNTIVNTALQTAIKSSPSPVYSSTDIKNITTCNLEDDLSLLKNVDWIIEVIVENLDAKKSLYNKILSYRKEGSIITTNTSGIPIHLLIENQSEEFKSNFCGTHFFNPPRYLPLLEIIPTKDTNPALIDFLIDFGNRFLGKTTVLCKDTPAFIANRIGMFSLMNIFHLMEEFKFQIDEIDFLTGPIIGRPKSASFRTADIVGIDTLIKVANGIFDNCKNDEANNIFSLPSWLQKMQELHWLGDKTKQGFYKKVKSENNTEILTLNISNFEYQPKLKKLFPSLQTIKNIDSLTERLKKIHQLEDNAGMFYKKMNATIFSYISFRIPEISNNLYNIDNAIKAGFGWEIGAFELWDLLGVEVMCTWMKVNNINYAKWIDTMLSKGITQFYIIKDNQKFYYDIDAAMYMLIPNQQQCIILEQYNNKIVWQNAACKLMDIGDEVLGLKWDTKMNTIGGEVIEGINQSIQIAEKNFKGIVIANDGPNFSVGANIALILMMAVEQDYDELEMAIATFQNTMMRIKYSSIPIAVAPHGLCFGGGCELSLHADFLRFVPETYIGLVEVGIGLIPAGGGTKEFTIRASDDVQVDEPDTIPLKNWFLKIATGQVSTSAFDAQKIGILRKGIDKVVMNPTNRIFEAKQSILQIQNTGYIKPIPRKDIRVLGRGGLALLEVGANAMLESGFATKHEIKVANKLANVMCGGDISEPTLVSEQYLLNLEREAFLSLCGEKKTLERIESMLKTGKTIRN